MSSNYKSKFNNWVEQEKLAVSLLNSVGDLMYDKGIELVFFRNHIVDVNIPEIMKFFKYAKEVRSTRNFRVFENLGNLEIFDFLGRFIIFNKLKISGRKFRKF